MNPRISIIIPVYNVSKYVGDCIKSVLIQDYDNIEVLIIDDCGTDNSIDIIKTILDDYKSTHIDFKFISHEKNRGIAAARNTGIDASTGDYLMFVDSDDMITLGVCSTLISKIQNTDYDIIVGNRDVIWTPTGEAKHMPWTRRNYEVSMSSIEDYEEYGLQGEAYNKLIRKSWLVKHQLYFEEGMIFEDTLWTKQIKCFTPKILYIPFVTYVYCLREGSLMTTYKAKHFISCIEAVRHMKDFAERRCPENTRWYANLSVYHYIKQSFTNCVLHTDSTFLNFMRLHRVIHKIINTLDYKSFKNKLSKQQRLRYTLATIPLIGKYIEYVTVSHICNKMLKSHSINNHKLNGDESKVEDYLKNL